MAVRSQSSASSLAKYAVARSPGVDLYNGNTSRDFCNSFWGVGDSGTNILFARMRGAARTTDSVRNFWKERASIEEEYAKKLQELTRNTLGDDEVGELRNALDTLHLESEKMAKAHLELASQIRAEMEEPTTALLNKQIEHRRTVQSPMEKKFKSKQSQESYVVTAREKYETDRVRIASYAQQIENNAPDLERIRQRLKRAEQTVGANEKDYANFCKQLADVLPGWEKNWKEFCDSCQDMEEERLDFMKDNLWAYANAVSVVCVADDVSCEAIRTVLDQLETERDIETFVNEYGTGNSIPNAPDVSALPVAPSSSSSSLSGNIPPISTSTRPANFTRKSRRPPPTAFPPNEENASINGTVAPPPPAPVPAAAPPAPPAPIPAPVQQPVSNGRMPVPVPAQPVAPPVAYNEPYQNNLNRRVSQPLPPQPSQAPYSAPPSAPEPPRADQRTEDDPGRPILFYVEALYDYTATIDEEFSFQAGDIIAVTATPDDGWWSGELLDENRRIEGRHVFPSNFVRLF